MSAIAKLGLAILTVISLLWTPVSLCGAMSLQTAPAHPCCPEKQVPGPECHNMACVCINTPQAPIAVPANDLQGAVFELREITAPAQVLAFAAERRSRTAALPDAQDSYLSIHQLLL
jgi:hypothetical protein